MTKKIAVASGKGGTGKTTIAVNLFYLLVKEGEHAGMADCDVEEPNAGLFLKGELIGLSDVEVLIPEIHSDVCTFCGKCVDICAYNAILMVPSVKHIQVMTDLCHSCGACSYVCPEKGAITEHPKKLGEVRGYGVFDMAAQHAEGRMEIGQAMAVPVIKQTKKLAPRADYQIIDAPPGTSCPAMETIGDADYTILVGEPTPFGMNDLKIMAETAIKMNRKFGVVINRSDYGNHELKTFLEDNHIDILMEIPFSRDFAEAYADGKILTEEFPSLKEKYLEMWNTIKLKIN